VLFMMNLNANKVSDYTFYRASRFVFRVSMVVQPLTFKSFVLLPEEIYIRIMIFPATIEEKLYHNPSLWYLTVDLPNQAVVVYFYFIIRMGFPFMRLVAKGSQKIWGKKILLFLSATIYWMSIFISYIPINSWFFHPDLRRHPDLNWG
jgi:hypothetical protein